MMHITFSTILLYLVYWEHLGNDDKGTRYSPLEEINKENVKQLELAWTYRWADTPDKLSPLYAHQGTPIMVDDGSGTGNVHKDINISEQNTSVSEW